MSDEHITYACDCACCECGAKAVAFWPCIDPDIPSYPYCRDCLNKAKLRVMIEIQKIDKKRNPKHKTRKS